MIAFVLIRFDDGIFYLLSLITMLFNHGSQLDANQLVNILLPYSKNPDKDLGRQCTIQPARAHVNTMLKMLRFIFAMSRKINSLMKDANETLGHMDVCQGKALFDVVSSYNVNSNKGRNELFKLLFDKKVGALGSIYTDMRDFETLFPKENKIFEHSVEQAKELYVY